ncbi:hypothetical protein KDA23_07785 [Candidatus Saccharibacteria bacterium]|nr:hypothetical protein [Candidatus Saccharibacteria bacterium]
MDGLGKAAAIAGIIGAVAAVVGVGVAVWTLVNQPTQRLPASSELPTDRTQSVLEEIRNPLSGTGCDTQCLPTFFRVESAGQNGAASVQVYNQAFGITDVQGVLEVSEGGREQFTAGYLPGRHGWYHLKLRIPGLSNGSKFKVCMNGKIEGRDLPITWRTSYEFRGSFEDANLRRLTPIEMKIGQEAMACNS